METFKYVGIATTNINTNNPISLGVVRGNSIKEIEEESKKLWLKSYNYIVSWCKPKKTIQISVEDKCWNVRAKYPYLIK